MLFLTFCTVFTSLLNPGATEVEVFQGSIIYSQAFLINLDKAPSVLSWVIHTPFLHPKMQLMPFLIPFGEAYFSAYEPLQTLDFLNPTCVQVRSP